MPFTKWDENGGMPRADRFVYWLLYWPFLFLLSCFTGFMFSGYDPVIAPKLHFGWSISWIGRALPTFLVGGVMVGLLYVPELFGLSLRFYLVSLEVPLQMMSTRVT